MLESDNLSNSRIGMLAGVNNMRRIINIVHIFDAIVFVAIMTTICSFLYPDADCRPDPAASSTLHLTVDYLLVVSTQSMHLH